MNPILVGDDDTMLCSVCKKNVAVIFITKLVNGKTEPLGLCIPCAQKQGLAPLDQFLQPGNLSEKDMSNISEQMSGLLGNMDLEDFTNPSDEDLENPFLQFMNSAFAGLKGGTNKEFAPDEAQNKKPSTSEESPSEAKTKRKKSKKRKYLDTYGINLSEKAKNKELDRIIGRHREIDRVIQILNRRAKNNPILIGEPGVGKTAIAEGLAVRIEEKQVPVKLFNAEIYLLDLTAVVAGTQFRGQFEGRMRSIIQEAGESQNIILVIDEVHNIMGAGEAEGGTMNAANILKPALARGEIQVIGTTTLDEYRKHIEKDSALERRFQPILVDEPNIEETIEILKGIKGYYEEYHKVTISDEIISSTVNLAERYITDRFLPDKAIDVIDEAGSRANLKNKGLVELEALRDELRKVLEEKEEAAAQDNYEKAADCKVKECKLQEQVHSLEQECGTVEITLEDVAYVIESWTKIPLQRITEVEAEKLLSLEDRLHKRIIGQHHAVTSLAKTIRRNRSGFHRKRKPASFIFVGPTGVGKTELAKALAVELFESEEAMVRFDMSEFMEKHTVSKLIGAPPGYVGYDQAGQLTEKVRRRPYSVILLDEIEKAHPEVFNLLLQILEDGRLTDGQGRTVHFENTVVIMTSNAGTSLKGHSIGFGKNDYYSLESKVHDALKEIFRAEFLNRVDETIVFTELSKDELDQIVTLMLKEVEDELIEKNLHLHMDDAVKVFLVDKGYDPKYGARPLRRTIQKYIEDPLAEEFLKGNLLPGSSVIPFLEKDKIQFKLDQ